PTVVLGDPLAADVDAGAAELDGRVPGEELRELVDELLVRVVPVRALQPLDRLRILETRDLALERAELGLERREPLEAPVALLREPAARRGAERERRARGESQRLRFGHSQTPGSDRARRRLPGGAAAGARRPAPAGCA